MNIGKEFPALLRISDMKNVNPKTYHDDYMNDKIYNLGENLKVYFLNMSDDVKDFIVTEYTKEHRESNKEDVFS